MSDESKEEAQGPIIPDPITPVDPVDPDPVDPDHPDPLVPIIPDPLDPLVPLGRSMNETIISTLQAGDSIFCENENIGNFLKLTISDMECSYDATNFTKYSLLIFKKGYILDKLVNKNSSIYWINV